MGHKRISNKRIKQMMNDISPSDEEKNKSNAVLVDKKNQAGKKDTLLLEDQQK